MAVSRVILVAEDEENDFFLLNWAFSRQDGAVRLVRVEDGVAAMDYLEGKDQYADRTRFPMPDLMILDLKMPRKDGFEVLEWLRSQPSLQSLIVVILSSSRQEEDVDRAFRLGVNSYLTKPNDSVGFIELARVFVNYWFLWSQPPRLAERNRAFSSR